MNKLICGLFCFKKFPKVFSTSPLINLTFELTFGSLPFKLKVPFLSDDHTNLLVNQ